MPSCVMCKSAKRHDNYFRFPNDEELRTKWLKFAKLHPLQCTASTRLCSRHFSSDCIVQKSSRCFLKSGATPSIIIAPQKKARKSKYARTICILCGNKSIDDSFFNIPKELDIKTKWESFCNLTLENDKYRLCHRHFNRNDIIEFNSMRKLKKDAIPTIYFDDIQFEYIPVGCSSHNVQSKFCTVCATKNSENPPTNDYDPSLNSSRLENETDLLSSTNIEKEIEPSLLSDAIDDISKGAEINELFFSNELSIENIPIAFPLDDDLLAENQSSANNMPEIITEFYTPRRKKRVAYPGDVTVAEINNFQHSQKSITIMRQTIGKKNKQLKNLQQKVRRLEQKVVNLKAIVNQYREKEKSESEKMDWW